MTASKPNRPLSHSQLWFNGSLSIPSRRVTRFDEDWTAARHPNEHSVHVDSTWSRSQGRAVNRYGDAVERAHRADLHGVAAEVRREDVLLEHVDLDGVTAPEEVDLRLARDLRREPDAAAALDAPLAVQQHELGDRDGLGPVPLLLEEPALARPVGEHLVLEGALAPLVAHRAVEGVVHEEELEHPVLGLLDLLGGGVDHHAVGDGHVTRRLQRGTAGPDTSTRHIRHMPTGFMRGW